MTHRKKTNRIECPICKKSVAITKTSKIANHGFSRRGLGVSNTQGCAASGKQAAPALIKMVRAREAEQAEPKPEPKSEDNSEPKTEREARAVKAFNSAAEGIAADLDGTTLTTAPLSEEPVYVAITRNYWGKGATVKEAKLQARKAGASVRIHGKGWLVKRMPLGAQEVHCNAMGDLCWTWHPGSPDRTAMPETIERPNQ